MKDTLSQGRRTRDRRWVFWVLAAAFAVQLYFVQELLAIVMLAAIVCGVFGAFIAAFLMLHRFGMRLFSALEGFGAPAADLSRRLLRRPHSQTAP